VGGDVVAEDRADPLAAGADIIAGRRPRPFWPALWMRAKHQRASPAKCRIRSNSVGAEDHEVLAPAAACPPYRVAAEFEDVADPAGSPTKSP
jgi:hypothetical protein